MSDFFSNVLTLEKGEINKKKRRDTILDDRNNIMEQIALLDKSIEQDSP